MLKSILKLKCPKCHKGDLFLDPNPYHLHAVDKMPVNCPSCGQPFQPEPGFYYGAMYISYGLCVGIFLIWFGVTELFMELSGYWFLGIYISALLILWPIIFRYSRAVYFYLFVRYDPNAAKKHTRL